MFYYVYLYGYYYVPIIKYFFMDVYYGCNLNILTLFFYKCVCSRQTQ